MTIWVLALLLLASGVGMGLRLGAIRAAFSFAGIVFGVLLAAPVGKIFKSLMPHVGIHNEALVWMIAPVEAFVLISVVLNVAGFWANRKAVIHYRYQEGDLRRILWERMNSRIGACIGVLNGSAYLVLVCFVIYNLSYWTAQVAQSDGQPNSIRLVNKMGRDLEDTGMAKAARSAAALPEDYYRAADLAGLLCQNPQLTDRFGHYPAFISLFESDDFQQLAQTSDFTNAWQSRAPVGEIMNQPQVKALLQNNALISTVWTTIETNLDDLTNYLQTGKSAKYDPEKILGHWDLNVGATVTKLGRTQPGITSSQMQSARAWMMKAYANTVFIAGTDGQAFLKKLPRLKPGSLPTTELADWKGSWTGTDASYNVVLTANGENKSMSAKISGDRLTLTDEKSVLIFDRED